MDDAALAALSAEQLRSCLLQDQNPYGELTRERYAELARLGIRDPLGYLTDDEWYARALRHIDPELAHHIVADLDTIDWADLEHPFGTAANVPILLRAALTEDELAAIVAWHEFRPSAATSRQCWQCNGSSASLFPAYGVRRNPLAALYVAQLLE